MLGAALYSKYTDSSYLVTKAIHELFDAVIAGYGALGTPPAVNYRCRVTVASVTGHTDCDGAITINSETLTFTATGQRKLCTTTITASTSPSISATGLDCNVLIECVDVGGAPIYSETEAAVGVAWNDTQKSIPSPEGGWTVITNTTASTEDSTIAVGDILRKTSDGADYTVKAVRTIKNHLGLEVKRILTF